MGRHGTPSARRGLSRTVRVVGLALAAGGRALDIALVETDGADHVRHVEEQRQPLDPAGSRAAVVAAVNTFLGDRALQPFALDLVALAADVPDWTSTELQRDLDIAVEITAPEGTTRQGSRAVRAAFAAVTAMIG